MRLADDDDDDDGVGFDGEKGRVRGSETWSGEVRDVADSRVDGGEGSAEGFKGVCVGVGGGGGGDC